MDLGSFLTSLENAANLLVTAAPDALDRTADVMDQISAASRDAAAYLRRLQGGAPAGAAAAVGPDAAARAAKIREQCRALTAPGDAAAALSLSPTTRALLVQLITTLLGVLIPAAA